MVWLADNTLLFHPFHNRGSTVVADLQAALDVARRCLLVALDDLHGLLVEVGGVAGLAHAGAIEDRIAVLVLVVGLGDFLKILRRTLRLEVADHLLDFVVRHEGAVDTADASAAGHVEHVALA